jgi:hypothetical protein
MPPDMPLFHFINLHGGEGQREKELLSSQAKAHATYISHKRISQQKALSLITESSSTRAEVQSRIYALDPWQMSKGYRHEPFQIIPGSNTGVAAIAMDFRKEPYSCLSNRHTDGTVIYSHYVPFPSC